MILIGLKYLETSFWSCTIGKYIYRWVILKTQRQKQTDDRTEKKEKKGGEETSDKCKELEGKGQALP